MTTLQKLIIVGASEIASVAYEYFKHDSEYEVMGFAVEPAYLNAATFEGLPLVSLEDIGVRFPPESHAAFVAVGDTQLNRVRARLCEKMKKTGYTLASYISSRAFVWHDAEIGENCFILEDNTIQPFVRIGDNVTLWSGNHIGHRAVIGDNCFISSHVVVSGFCSIGANSFVGVNASLAHNVSVGADNYIAMASAITASTADDQILQGNPAEARKLSAKRFCRVKE